MFSHRQSGFTLVELMVAMVVGTVIILGAGQLFLTTLQTFQKVKEISQKQEVLVFAASSIVNSVRSSSAGSYGDSGYSLKCEMSEDESFCKCVIYKDQGEPILNFKKDIVLDQCANEEDLSKPSEKNEYLYSVEFPIEVDGKIIKFNVASRGEILDEYYGDTEGDTGKTPEGFYTDGTRMYNDDCYSGSSNNFKLKFEGCNAP
ncbi:prepilin-type N-terminal cleavage/methylation domain-containing protein [Vreelandella rituensis]|uniref:Prepilin-type N-terminal cleavage/methylation domain-containing protein n=1 Tax=Vreelandella rituensis TaxID=2282306 RepID=A0A368U2J9_9GAMM|nr:prepilin-type N-terminal cleavage/methylation domain-containing protein [Halomonas rituensis]RCV90322.1 prepilin-type N-terminal cleavage/methylation domain-containing protein [Halomonas rituensis]